MTLRELLDQVKLQGKIRIQEITDDETILHYCGCVERLNTQAKLLDREIAYIYPSYVADRREICIEIK